VPQNHEAATPDELRQLEAHIDARLRAVAARFVAVDGRLTNTDARVVTLDEQAQTVATRFERRFRSIDNRLDANYRQTDDVGPQISTQLARTRHQLILGLALGSVLTAALCICTTLVLA
jgi:hypothetical protein